LQAFQQCDEETIPGFSQDRKLGPDFWVSAQPQSKFLRNSR
jgi:hypothetical protein